MVSIWREIRRRGSKVSQRCDNREQHIPRNRSCHMVVSGMMAKDADIRGDERIRENNDKWYHCVAVLKMYAPNNEPKTEAQKTRLHQALYFSCALGFIAESSKAKPSRLVSSHI